MEKPPEAKKTRLESVRALKESYRRLVMDYPSRLGNPAKVVSIFGSAINTGLHAVIEKVTGAFRTLLISLMQCLPSSAEDTMKFERHLHQEVARKYLDPFMGEILQEALTSSTVVDKAEEVIRYHMSHPRLQWYSW